jgi:ethanolamine utilization protein EutP (predicted NTPase)
MKGIGGNTQAVIQVKHYAQDENGKYIRDSIGSVVMDWVDAQTIRGWLDLNSGDSRYTTYYAKIQESTHIFIADYVNLDERISAENARMRINGKLYDITLIDNPMGMGSGSQLEIYLKFVGGQ